MSITSEHDLDALLEHVRQNRGFDFTGYKRPSLERRVSRRIEDLGLDSTAAYLDHLEVNPDEFAALFDTIFINVTGFFRDAPAWDYLASDVIPKILATRGEHQAIRVWCAGCATGEETFTTAMVLAEALGTEAYCKRVKIYATDVDGDALDHARAAVFSAKQLEAVPQELRDRYFVAQDQRYAFRKELRRTVIFGRNDLVQDAPISRVDLLLCRNTLMYFNAETQAKILRRFHFALNPEGFLFLGRAEMLIAHTDLFTPDNMKRRVFTKVVRPSLRDRLMPGVTELDLREQAGHDGHSVRESAFDTAPVAQIVVAREGTLLLANRRARTLLGLAPDDIARALNDLDASERPSELRSTLREVFAREEAVTLTNVRIDTAGKRSYDVVVAPLSSDGETLGASVTYLDLTGERIAKEELERAQRELSSAYEELQSTVEELETTNEELQSTNEELETTNEELQSTNEELETMNEELQSTNEELETINEELRTRTYELNELNAFMEVVMETMNVAVMVVDPELRVQVWNRHAEDLWGIRSDEAEGKHVLDLDIGLSTEALRAPIRDCLGGAHERCDSDLPATDRKGREFTCHVSVLPLRVARAEITGAIVLMERSAPAG
jgi:two-component system CheB/CheR fusion protein